MFPVYTVYLKWSVNRAWLSIYWSRLISQNCASVSINDIDLFLFLKVINNHLTWFICLFVCLFTAPSIIHHHEFLWAITYIYCSAYYSYEISFLIYLSDPFYSQCDDDRERKRSIWCCCIQSILLIEKEWNFRSKTGRRRVSFLIFILSYNILFSFCSFFACNFSQFVPFRSIMISMMIITFNCLQFDDRIIGADVALQGGDANSVDSVKKENDLSR